MIPLDSFVGQSADGKMVPIIPGGNSIPLTFSNRKEYVERAIEYRLHEIDRQVQKRPLHTRHVKSMPIFCVLKIFFGLTSSVQQMTQIQEHSVCLLFQHGKPNNSKLCAGLETNKNVSLADLTVRLNVTLALTRT